MVHPYNDVLGGISGGTYRNRSVFGVERDQRTGRIKSDSRNRVALDAGQLQGLPCRRAARRPDIVRRLLHEIGLRLPHPDGMARRSYGSALRRK